MKQEIIDNYINILKNELELAVGCTEPVSIAYCSAMAKLILGKMPDKMKISVSGNILKNAMGVVIPNTTLRGVIPAAILGVIGGNAIKKLAVLDNISEADIEKTKELMTTDFASLECIKTDIKLYIEVTLFKDNDFVTVEIRNTHTNIVRIEKNGKISQLKNCDEDFNSPQINRKMLNVHDIYEFASTVDIEPILPIIKEQIKYNYEISKAGLNSDYGLNVGATWLKYTESNDVIRIAKAYTAAGSDARMSGACLPVVTNTGSGNQGITASVPLIIYAEYKKIPDEKLYRALVLSDLIAIHIKTRLGLLSAFCGVVVAATGAACGITYLDGGNLTQIEDTIKNILASIAGVFCDGAKPTCASKIASSIDAAFQASMLAMNNHRIEKQSGIIADDIEQTINNIGEIGQLAMNEVDKKIIEIMKRGA